MKRTLKLFAFAMLMICAVCAFAVMANAAGETEGYVLEYTTYDADYPEKCVLNDGTANDLKWYWDEEATTITIRGTSTALDLNPAPDWKAVDNYPWNEYKNLATRVVIEAPITRIADNYALSYMNNVETIVLPDTTVSVSAHYCIFSSNPNLKKICTASNEDKLSDYTFDFRTLSGTAVEILKGSAKTQEITVLLPYEGTAIKIEDADNAAKSLNDFQDITKVTFKYAEGSEGASTADAFIALNDVSATAFAKTAYTADEMPGMPAFGTMKDTRNDYTWTFDGGALTLTTENAWDGIKDLPKSFITYAHEVKSLTLVGTSCIQGVSTVEGSSGFFSVFKNLEAADISGVSQIRVNAFNGCTSLKSVTVGSDAQLGKDAFKDTAITEITLPDNVSFRDNATNTTVFTNCTLTIKTTKDSQTWNLFDGAEGITLVDPNETEPPVVDPDPDTPVDPPVAEPDESKVEMSATARIDGEYITLTTYIDKNPGISGMYYYVYFDDTRLEPCAPVIFSESMVPSYDEDFNEIPGFAFTSGFEPGVDPSTYGSPFHGGVFYSVQDITKTGALATYRFRIKEGTSLDNLTFSFGDYSMANCYNEDLSASFDGIPSVTAAKPMQADTNDDGEINMADLIRLAQYLANWDVYLFGGDVNGDGNISVQDLVHTAQFLAEWDVAVSGGGTAFNGWASAESGAGSPKFTVETELSGSHVFVNVYLNDNPGIAGIRYNIHFDSDYLTPALISMGNEFTPNYDENYNEISGFSFTSGIQAGVDASSYTEYIPSVFYNTSNVTRTGLLARYLFKLNCDPSEIVGMSLFSLGEFELRDQNERLLGITGNYKSIVPIKNAESITLDKASAELTVGDSFTLKATVLPEDTYDTALTWKSSDSAVASVSSSGVVTAHKLGSAYITVSNASGNVSAICTVNVTRMPVSGVSLDIASGLLTTFESYVMKPVITPADATNKNVTYQSSDMSVITVDASGCVKAVGEGTATITVKTEDGGKTASCTFTVTDFAVTVSNGAVVIDGYVFDEENIVIPESIGGMTVTEIGGNAFSENADSLERITIPTTVKKIGESAFDGCDNLKAVLYKGTESDWKKVALGENNSAITAADVYFNYSFKTGDADCDGKVQMPDLVMLAQYFAGWSMYIPDIAAADVNSDGELDVRDVVLLAQYLAGWEVTLG